MQARAKIIHVKYLSASVRLSPSVSQGDGVVHIQPSEIQASISVFIIRYCNVQILRQKLPMV